eukprot:15325437-Ditylum_brightwellii.AAC.1
MEINNNNIQEQINPTIKLMEEETDNKVEDNTTNNWISDEDKSVELVGNPFMLTKEKGQEAEKSILRSMQMHLLRVFSAKSDTGRKK